MMLKTIAISLALTFAAAAPLAAQGKAATASKVPPGQRPPAGMCRIWLDGVPPGQQPAPTDCATAVRNRPANGRVIFGDDYLVDRRGKKLNDDADERRTAPREERDSNRANDDARRDDRSTKQRGDDGGKGANRKARPHDTARADGDH